LRSADRARSDAFWRIARVSPYPDPHVRARVAPMADGE